MPAKESGDISAQVDSSIFLLLVRGASDRAPLTGEYLDSDYTPKPKEPIVSDGELEDTGARGRP